MLLAAAAFAPLSPVAASAASLACDQIRGGSMAPKLALPVSSPNPCDGTANGAACEAAVKGSPAKATLLLFHTRGGLDEGMVTKRAVYDLRIVSTVTTPSGSTFRRSHCSSIHFSYPESSNPLFMSRTTQ